MNSSDISPVIVTPARSLPAAPAASADDDNHFTLDDLIDIVNPLQHIPVVGTLYRHLTGDTIKTFPKIAGDTLYGGLEGFAGSVADTLFEKITGHNFGDTALALVEKVFNGGTAPDAPDTGVAANDPAASPGTSLLARIENLFSSSPAGAPVTAVADAAPIDTTATPVPSSTPALTAPAVVSDASLDTLVIPGQETLLQAIRSVGAGADSALRGVAAYRRAIGVHTANMGLQSPALRASLN